MKDNFHMFKENKEEKNDPDVAKGKGGYNILIPTTLIVNQSFIKFGVWLSKI